MDSLESARERAPPRNTNRMRRRFKPTAARPRDFDRFWDDTWDALRRIDPETAREPLPAAPASGVRGDRVTFTSLDGARVSGYLVHGTDGRPRPLVVHSHGYACRCEPRWDWAERGLNVLGVDIRGFGLSKDAVSEPSPWGMVLTGIESPETSILRGAVCDFLQGWRAARDLLGDAHSRTVFHGVSFSGGLALMAQGVGGVADLVAVGVPTFGWSEGRHFFVKQGSGAEISAYLARRPEQVEDVMLVLRYFDTVHFAHRVRCPTLVGVGLEDDVVPAKTVFGIVNHLGGPVEVMEFPCSHTERPEEQLWERFEERWLTLALEGAPAGFGVPAGPG